MPKLEYVSLSGLRLDGRRPLENRQIKCRLSLFTKVDGSAYLEMGNTKVIAVVYGPREVRSGAAYTLKSEIVIR
jgi:exosome complex component RRP41